MSTAIGGQAVMEGVMMRGPSNWAVAVRKPDGDIAQVCRPVRSAMARPRFFRLPLIACAVAIVFVLLVFKVGPALFVDQVVPVRNGTYFVIIEGLVRVSFFIIYL